jgi:Family of unknown function (DUF6152)
MMRWTVAVAAALVLYDSRVQAHHSIFSIYDQNRQATLEGTVAEFLLVNPHPFLFIDVDEAGATKRWRLEMDNRSELAGIGVTATTFKRGDRVIVRGSLARNEAQSLYLLRLDRAADGFWYEQVGQSPRIRSATR